MSFKIRPKNPCDFGVIDLEFYEKKGLTDKFIYLGFDGDIIDGSRKTSMKALHFKENKEIIMKVDARKLKVAWKIDNKETVFISHSLGSK